MVLFKENNKDNKNEYLIDERVLKTSRDYRVKTPKIKPKIVDVLPIEDMTGNGYFEFKNDQGYLEIVQIESKDIYSANEEERDGDINSLTYLYQAYPYDIKIVPMNFPVNTETQKNYYQRLINKCKIPSYIPHLEEKYRELEYLEENRTNREYFLFIYAETEYDLKERTHVITRLLSKSNPLIHLSEDKKIKIVNKLYNMNTKTYTN